MEISEIKQKELYELVKPKIEASLMNSNLTLENALYTPGARKGEAVLGKILQITALGRCNGMQRNVDFLVKYAVENYLNQELPIKEAYKREILMYTEVFPAFMNVQDDLLNNFMGFPEYFGSDINAEPQYIILGDLKFEGYKTIDRTKPLDYDHMVITIKEYAKFHALSFALRANSKLATLETKLAETFYTSMKNLDINFISRHCARALETLNHETDRAVLRKFDGMADYIFTSMKEATTADKAQDFKVICHGDCSITNLMFKYPRNSTKPTNVSFVDFQLAKLGSPALDLSHLFFACTDKELRTQHLQELLKLYHKELIEFGQAMNVQIDVPFKVLQDHMVQFSVYGLYMAITNLYMKMSSDDDIPTVEEIYGMNDAKERFEHPCANYDAFAKRIRDVLIDFHDYSYRL